jgi:CubicO group peptidase (beta-lactamase class C family)
MKQGQILLGAVFALASLVLMAGTAEAAGSCEFQPALSRFDQLLASEGLPGGAVLIGTRQGVLLERYAGTYNANTVVAIASASKLASAIRIAQLIDRGVLDAEAPVSELLPQFTGEKAEMTLLQLFSHTSGYGNDSAAPEITDRSISLAEAVDQIACCRDFPTGYGVGQQFAYGGVSMHIGGRMAEVATGEDWQTSWQRELGAPLGISGIDWEAFGATTNYMIAGGARSNLTDYGRLVHLLLNEGWANGQRLLSRDAVFGFWQDRVGSLPVIDPPPTVTLPVRYGLGSWIDGSRNVPRPPLIHSLGAFGYFPWVDFEAGLYGVFMIRGLPGINTRALPVYLNMVADIRSEIAANSCVEIERFNDVFSDGLEGQGAPFGAH